MSSSALQDNVSTVGKEPARATAEAVPVGAATATIAGRGRALCYPELLRAISCLVVVIAHTDLRAVRFAAPAVAVFFAISLEFGLNARSRASLLDRARKVFGLWLVWSLIFAAVIMLRNWANGREIIAGFSGRMLLTGPSIHLWFLPMLGLMYLALAAGFGFLRGVAVGIACLAACVPLVLLKQSPMEPTRLVGFMPLAQWWLAAISFGASIGFACLLPARLPAWTSFAGWALLAIGFGLHWSSIDVDSLRFPLCALASIVLCRAAQPSPPAAVSMAGNLTPGVYVFHPVMISAANMLALPMVAAMPFVVIGSGVAVHFLRRSPIAGFLRI